MVAPAHSVEKNIFSPEEPENPSLISLNSKPRRKKNVEKNEAIRRVELIGKMLIADVRNASQTRAVFDAGNNTLPKILDKNIRGAHALNIIQRSLIMKLALDVARIFDVSENRELVNQDKASIQVSASLLSIREVRKELMCRAGKWTPQINSMERINIQACLKAINMVIAIADKISGQDADVLLRIRQFRTKRLAHALFDQTPDNLPTLNDIFCLMNYALDASRNLSLALEGINYDTQESEDLHRADAEEFYSAAAAGLTQIN